jgi:hypothetical protein
LALSLAVYFVFWKRRDAENGFGNTALLYWAFMAALFIAWNIQLVTGFISNPDHWFRVASPFIFIISAHVAFELLKRLPYRKVLTGVLIFLSLLLVAKKVVNAALFIHPPQEVLASYTFDPGIVGSWDWINAHLPGEPVIASPSFITGLYLNDYTSARPYLLGAFNTAASNALIEERFLRTYKAFGVSPAVVLQILSATSELRCADPCSSEDYHRATNFTDASKFMYSIYYKYYPGRPVPTSYVYIPKEKVDELYARYLAMPPISWKDVEADYVYFGPWERDILGGPLKNTGHLQPVFSDKDVAIYRILR